MGNHQPPGVKCDAGRELQLAVVLAVADNGVSVMGHLQPDLVLSPRFQFDFQERNPAVARKQTIGESCLLRPRTSAIDYMHAAVPFILDKPVDIVASGRMWASCDKHQ